jgi:hypothetical protein
MNDSAESVLIQRFGSAAQHAITPYYSPSGIYVSLRCPVFTISCGFVFNEFLDANWRGSHKQQQRRQMVIYTNYRSLVV